jgi:hypothetical protein
VLPRRSYSLPFLLHGQPLEIKLNNGHGHGVFQIEGLVLREALEDEGPAGTGLGSPDLAPTCLRRAGLLVGGAKSRDQAALDDGT